MKVNSVLFSEGITCLSLDADDAHDKVKSLKGLFSFVLDTVDFEPGKKGPR